MPEDRALQFDTAMTPATLVDVAATPSVVCASCQRTIETEYYEVAGNATCQQCRATFEAFREAPHGIGPLLKAGAFGVGAGIAGAIVYYAVIALANLEIGIVAILIGYMVGYSVRKGAGNRGGRRFQVLAVTITYASIALAYTPLAIKGALAADKTTQSSASKPVPTPPAPERRPGSIVVALALLGGLIAVLPVLVVVGGLPSSLISAAIIFFGMRQAWKMTGLPSFEISGPYRIGTARPAASS